MSPNEIACTLFMFLGVFFSLMATLGLLRFPDLFLRMAAATKAGTLGAGFNLLAVAAYFNNIEVTTKAIAAILFLVLTAPVGAHLIGRAAYISGVKLWKGSVRDDLKGRYDKEAKAIRSK